MFDKQIKQLEKELEEVKKQAQEYLEGWQRAKADYINREREIERDKSIWIEFITLDFILKILPIAENFERLLEHYKKTATTESQNKKETQKIATTETQNSSESQKSSAVQSSQEKPAITETQKNSESQKISEIQSLQGVEQIKKQFDDLLKGLGIEKIKTIGEKFNPEFHEAVGRDATNNKEPTTATAGSRYGGITNNIIIEEVSPGYKMNGKAIKPAKVIVR